MTYSPFKIIGLVGLTLALSAGTALAGGENCKDKKHTAMQTTAAVTATPQTSVLSEVEQANMVKTAKASKTMKATYTFDEALELCTKKGVSDLQACVDYKTGVSTVKPQS